ncbi:MAG: SCP2 sterol-binding domain-containing protein [Candidatus Hermodarchaeota archaeon]
MYLTCTGCGKEIETLPLQCAHSLNINNETNQMECYMENCGIISINEFICESCCSKRNIIKLNKKIEQLSLENEEFKEELTFFKKNLVQAKINDSDFNFWVEFGNGAYLFDNGIKENPSISITCSQETMLQIFKGSLEPFGAFLSGNLKIGGDLQYAVVFFDLLKLASEITKEIGGV